MNTRQQNVHTHDIQKDDVTEVSLQQCLVRMSIIHALLKSMALKSIDLNLEELAARWTEWVYVAGFDSV